MTIRQDPKKCQTFDPQLLLEPALGCIEPLGRGPGIGLASSAPCSSSCCCASRCHCAAPRRSRAPAGAHHHASRRRARPRRRRPAGPTPESCYCGYQRPSGVGDVIARRGEAFDSLRVGGGVGDLRAHAVEIGLQFSLVHPGRCLYFGTVFGEVIHLPSVARGMRRFKPATTGLRSRLSDVCRLCPDLRID